MGSFANTLFTVMLGWLQSAVSAVWSAFTTADGKSLLTWIGDHWLLLAGILCITGAAADLCIYIIRWKPHRVWKSFFNRIRSKNEEDETDPEEPSGKMTSEETARIPACTATQHAAVKEDRRKYEEADLSQWESRTQVIEVQKDIPEPSPRQRPATVTNAGYVIPEDSPYRRPAARTPETDINPRISTAGTVSREPEYRPEEQIRSKYRRRRKINVTDLFSDPEAELKELEAPQDLFDRKKAYRDPVYPRGWKKSEDDGQ